MIVSLLTAIVGVILTAIQALLIHLQDTSLCQDEGCRIVDAMTTVDPLYFNLAGLAFFLVISFGLSRARRGSENWRRLVSLLLIAALAAEGVLLSFQTVVAQAYCSYCLIILALLLVINLFLGLKQMAKALLVFGSVLLAFASLDFSASADNNDSLQEGTLAHFQPSGATHHFYLFFSSTCNHCETIIEELTGSNHCAVSFNPIDTITSFTFPGATFTEGYRPQVNRAFLKKLEVLEVPVLLERTDETITIIRGETAIRDHLRKQCGLSAATPLPTQSLSGQSSLSPPLLPPAEDGCSILSDCEEPPETSAAPPATATP